MLKKILATFLALFLLAFPVWGALEFDGSTQYIDTADIDLTTWTIVLKLKSPDAPGTASIQQAICETYAYEFIWSHTNADFMQSFAFRDTGDVWQKVQILQTLYANTWYWLIGTYDGTNLRAYVNGSLDNTSSPGTTPTTSNYVTKIGCASGSSGQPLSYFPGTIAEARLYNRAISLAEVQAITFSEGSDNIVEGLVGRWLMDEKPDGEIASGTDTVIDVSKEGNHGTPYNSPIYRASPLRVTNPLFN